MKTTSKTASIIMSVCEIIVGILLLIKPVGFTAAIITCLGIVLLAAGIASIIQYFRTAPAEAAVEQGMARGLLEIVFGIFCIARSSWFISTFPVLTVLYGVGILVAGLTKVQWMVDMVRLKVKKWFWAAISAALTLLCAVIILCNPFSTIAVLWMFIAITLIVEAVVDIVATIFTKK